MELRNYQLELVDKGILILKQHNIVYFALEMRLGKTFISLFIANHFSPKKVIFVTKKKAIKNIQGDFNETNFSWNLICTN
jgi:superfamily II DNA or RNA helicase